MPTPLYFDSHCHLQDERFDSDRDDVIARACGSGVREIVVIASDPEDAAAARGLAETSVLRDDWPVLWHTAGLHPHGASRWNPRVREAVELELDRGAVAVGEIGLDYHYDNSPRGAQRTAFADQLAIARARDLPVVVHSREAEDETLAVIRDSGIDASRVVMHCFTGSARMLDEVVERGYYVSFSGIATFSSFDADGLVPRVPEDRILVETDAPYLAPVPYRGSRNEPAFLAATIASLAGRRATTPERLAATTRANARAFYRIAE